MGILPMNPEMIIGKMPMPFYFSVDDADAASTRE